MIKPMEMPSLILHTLPIPDNTNDIAIGLNDRRPLWKRVLEVGEPEYTEHLKLPGRISIPNILISSSTPLDWEYYQKRDFEFTGIAFGSFLNGRDREYLEAHPNIKGIKLFGVLMAGFEYDSIPNSRFRYQCSVDYFEWLKETAND